MSALRALTISYLAAASLFSLALCYSDHAALGMLTREELASLSQFFQARVTVPLLAFARLEDEKMLDPQVSLALAAPGPNDARTFAHADVPAVPQRTVVAPELELAAPDPVILAPDLPAAPSQTTPSSNGFGGNPPPSSDLSGPQASNAMLPDPEGPSPLSQAERSAVTEQFAQNLTPEMVKDFDLFLYVSKAPKGPLAQRLYVFRKNSGGALQLAYDWAASTGREQVEVSPLGERTKTDTPTGFYELDPSRMYRAYHSHAWDQSMPYAMFFNWETHGDQTGLAIHAAVGDDISKLGSRASAGCVHISPLHAQLLYEMIRADYKGQVPRFAYDNLTHSMSNRGMMLRDAHGNIVMQDGYRVLVDIENLSGADRLAALD